MPWSLGVMPQLDFSNIKHFSVYAYCNEGNQSPHWTCEASMIFNLLSSKVGQKSHSLGPLVHTFSTKQLGRGFPWFISWDKVLDPANGFIREEDGGVVVEAEITVTNVIGLVVPTRFDFTVPQSDLTDVALIVDEKPLHVCKAYLAYHSPVFRKMFFSDFAEKEKKEIPLEDVKYDEFMELLQVIFPSRKPVAVATVEGLLRLDDRFNMQTVVLSCEEFLQGPNSKEVSLAKKLLLSDQFRLANLQYNCLQTIKTVDDVRVVKRTKDYGDFSSELNDALFERSLELR